MLEHSGLKYEPDEIEATNPGREPLGFLDIKQLRLGKDHLVLYLSFTNVL